MTVSRGSKPGARGAVLLSVILQWLAAYLVWNGAAGLARRHGLIESYEPRLFLFLALGAGAVHVYVRARGTRTLARVVFAASQLLWLVVILVQDVAVSEADAPRILSGFGDRLGPEGFPRLEGAHRGVDMAALPGSPVLAATDGRVAVAKDNGDACGVIVVIDHHPHAYRTVYCHLSGLSVTPGEEVKRGQRIGTIGMTGLRAWPGYEHVHWELRRGGTHEDPIARTVGCFDATKEQPADRLVLTYPVKCPKVGM